MSTRVYYNGTQITPTPFVSRDFAAIDIGQRWGYSENIKLDGVVTGAQGTAKIGVLTSLFSRSYKTLLIESAADSFYSQIDNCVLDSISIGENKFALETNNAIPYSVSLKAFHSTSGVTDVSDSISFNEGEDGIVSISRSVKAKGLYDGNLPIDNAYSFVSMFTGRSPLNVASPIFIQSGQPILKSLNEQIDREAGTYEVSETWEYETGKFVGYTTVSSLSINTDKGSEYPTASLSVEFNGSITGSIDSLRSSASSYNYYSKLSEFGLNSGQFFLNSMSFEEREPNSISASLNYVSGLSSEFTTGVFKHEVSLDWDEVLNQKTYSINSDFVIKGPPEYRLSKINQASTAIVTGYKHYIAYLYHVIINSELFSSFSGRPLNPIPSSFSIKKDVSNPALSFSATYDDSDFFTESTDSLPNGLPYPISIGTVEYKLDFEPESWIFNIDRAANIEGHFIVQDLNCKTRNKFSLDITTNHPRETIENGQDINSAVSFGRTQEILSGILNQIGSTRYETNSNINSGTFSHSIQKTCFSNGAFDPRLSANKFYGFLGASYNTRGAGRPFGF